MSSLDYRIINIPYIPNSEIESKAAGFREQYWDGKIPVNIERIIEIKLKMNIVPVKNMNEYCDADALISSNWENIFVDEGMFVDERYLDRLRFSFAHELGHFNMHKKLYETFDIRAVSDFYRFISEIDEKQYGYLETQANKFACALLLPREMLIADANKLYNILSSELDVGNVELAAVINAYIAKPIALKYGVSDYCAEIALNSIRNKENGG
ncbi:MAG: ImmA/IrrE family metallo-endopeptidase [Patescibacteria group bacterium]